MTSQKDVPLPIPYYPTLARLLGGVTISIVFVYLETIHHSDPATATTAEPARAGLRMPPVSLDCDRACDDLGVCRRTLHTSLDSLSTWWPSEEARSAATRAGRGFLAQSTKSFPPSSSSPIRPYATVGTRKFESSRSLTIHRNQMRIAQILTLAGLLPQNHFTTVDQTPANEQFTGRPGDILQSVLGVSVPRGMAWGWSADRRREHGERMVRLWAERREKAQKRQK